MDLFRRFSLNTKGRDFLITDTHGCLDEVREFKKRVNYNGSKDRLFHNGDHGDRGPQSLESIAYFLGDESHHSNAGNHDAYTLQWLKGELPEDYYRLHGGSWFIELPREKQLDVASLIAQLPWGMEIETPHGLVGIVHGEPLITWERTVHCLEHFAQQHRLMQMAIFNQLLWGRERWYAKDKTPVPDIDTIYVGHTVVDEPLRLGNIEYIDGGLVYGGRLNVINLTENTRLTIPAFRQYWDAENKRPLY
jgi:serine/threonine protein phosphatase 1